MGGSMAFDILENMDHCGVRCEDCGEVLVSQFSPYGDGITISSADIIKLQEHKRTCPKKWSPENLKKARLAKAPNQRVPT